MDGRIICREERGNINYYIKISKRKYLVMILSWKSQHKCFGFGIFASFLEYTYFQHNVHTIPNVFTRGSVISEGYISLKYEQHSHTMSVCLAIMLCCPTVYIELHTSISWLKEMSL